MSQRYYIVYLFNLLLAETKQLLQDLVSHLSEYEEVSEKFELFH